MPDDLTIPPDIEVQYEGRWIAWDTEAHVVLAEGEAMEDIVDATRDAVAAGKLIWFHNCLPRDIVLVGGIW